MDSCCATAVRFSRGLAKWAAQQHGRRKLNRYAGNLRSECHDDMAKEKRGHTDKFSGHKLFNRGGRTGVSLV